MTPAIMTHEVGSKVRLRLEVLLLNIADCANNSDEPSLFLCGASERTADSLAAYVRNPGVERVQLYEDNPDCFYEEWSPWCSRVRVLCYQDTKYRSTFAWLADVLTSQDDYCEAALQRAEIALVKTIAGCGVTPESLMAWACKDGGVDHPDGGFFPERRQRRLAFVKDVLSFSEREEIIQSPRHQSMKSLLTRPRSPAIVNRNPPQPRTPPKPPPPPPPPPEPVLPSEDLRAAGRVRLVEVLAHPTNLGLLGLTAQDLNPQLPISRLRSLLATLRQGCGGVA